jgi:hypothetical protein
MKEKPLPTEGNAMTKIEAALLEKAIVDRTGLTDIIAILMGKSSYLWHDLIRGIAVNVEDKKILEQLESLRHISGETFYAVKPPPAKYAALKRIAIFFDLLADVFKVIEASAGGKVEVQDCKR